MSEKLSPFAEELQLLEQVAFAACAVPAQERLTERELFGRLTHDTKQIIRNLPRGHDEMPHDSIMNTAYRREVVEYDANTGDIALGKFGRALIDASFEQRL